MDLLLSIIVLVVGVGVFLIGVVYFSDSLAKTASSKMRVLFKKISGNRLTGFGLGVTSTVAVQSSSATTVMVVGLVNVGILSLFQATSIIIGANVGSALTLLMVSLATSWIRYFFMALAFVGAFIKLMIKKEIVARVADIMISLGLLFVGLYLLGSAFEADAMGDVFKNLFAAFNNPILLLLLGVAFTLITQSNAGTAAVIIMLAMSDHITFPAAMYILTGANIGTTLTALMAAATANTNAKRAAFIHFLINVVGAILFLAVFWPLEGPLTNFAAWLIPDGAWRITIFHILYRILSCAILIFFIKPLNQFTAKLIKEKVNDEEIVRPVYISDTLLSNPKAATYAVIKELKDLTEKAQTNVDVAFDAFINRRFDSKDRVFREKVKIDILHEKVTSFLVKVSHVDLSDRRKKLMGEFYHFAQDIKRIAGHAIFLINNTLKMKEEELKLTDEQVSEMRSSYRKVVTLFGMIYDAFDDRIFPDGDFNMTSELGEKLQTVLDFGESVKKILDTFADSYLNRVAEGEFTVEVGEYIYSTFLSFRHITSYLTKMAETLMPTIEYKQIMFDELM